VARLYADENFPLRVVQELRSLGYDVLTALEAGQANQRIADADVLAFAASLDRAILTVNRRDFIRLHHQQPLPTTVL
jgi:predicted nuclease of predicted toxin-antitoxin system